MRLRAIGLVLVLTVISLLPGLPAQATVARVSTHATRLQITRLWRVHISPNADSSALSIAQTPGHLGPTVYALAGNNGSNCNPGDPVRKATLYALNEASGSVRWSRSTSGPARCTTSGPVTDASHLWVYVPGLDGKLHRYNSSSGKESIDAGWPVPYTLMPDVEKVSVTPTVHSNHLYITTSGFIGDGGHYQGHLVSVDLASARVHIFNTLCSNLRVLLGPAPGKANYCTRERSGLFGRGEATVDPVSHDVYIVSGNGPWNGKTDWGDSILKLNPTGTTLLDSYTPSNQKNLEDTDQDLGSTGPAMLPGVRRGGQTYYLLAQGGKGPACASCSGVAIRLLNRAKLSGKNGPGHVGGDLSDTQAPGGCEILTAPAVWKGPSGSAWVFYANSCGTAAYRIGGSGSHFRLDRIWANRSGGTTPRLHGNVLYVASAGHVTAYDPASGTVLASASGTGSIHWEYPAFAGNRMFITDEAGSLTCYTLY